MTPNQIVFLAMTVGLWLLFLLVLKSVVGVDATGDRDIFLGLRWIFAGVLVFLEWVGIAGALLVAGSQGNLPGWVQVSALVLVPLSGLAAEAALYEVANETAMRWPLVVPVVTPPLMAGYLVALYGMPGFAGRGHIGVWAAMLALSVMLAPSLVQMHSVRHVRVERQTQAYLELDERQKDQHRQASLERLNSLPPDAELARWMELAAPDSDVREEAIARMRQSPRRQQDVTVGVEWGSALFMQLTPELDLQATPELCAAARKYCDTAARDLARGKRPPVPYERQGTVDAAIAGLAWLQARGCDCNRGIAQLEAAVKSYVDSPARQKALAELREARNGK